MMVVSRSTNLCNRTVIIPYVRVINLSFSPFLTFTGRKLLFIPHAYVVNCGFELFRYSMEDKAFLLMFH